MARAKPLGGGRVVLTLTEQEAEHLWLLLSWVSTNPAFKPPLQRVHRALGAAREGA